MIIYAHVVVRLYVQDALICSRRRATLRARRSYDHDSLHTHAHSCLQVIVLSQHCLVVILLVNELIQIFTMKLELQQYRLQSNR